MKLLPNFSSLLDLDLDIHAGRKVQTHEHVNGLGVRVEDVDQAVVRAHFKVLVRVFVNESGTSDGKSFDFCRQGYRTNDTRAAAFRRFDDTLG